MDASEAQLLRQAAAQLWQRRSGPEVILKTVCLILIEKGRGGYIRRLADVGHELNAQLGKDCRAVYGGGATIRQLLEDSSFFEIVPTAVRCVDAVQLNVQKLLASGKVRVVLRPINSNSSKGSPNDASNSISPAAADTAPTASTFTSPPVVKGAALLAYVSSLRWHESAQINMLRQSLAANLVRRATAGTAGKAAPAYDSQLYSIDAAQAGTVLEKAWQGRYPAESYPYTAVAEVLAGDKYLSIVPAAADAAGDNSSSNSNQQVRLDVQLLLEHKAAAEKKAAGSAAASPATPTPVAAAATALLKQTAKSAKAATKGSSALSSDAAAGALAAKRASLRPAASPGAANGGNYSTSTGDWHTPPQQLVPKGLLLGFIQGWQWSSNADYNLMKRALATFLVNRAAAKHGGLQCPLELSQQNVAQSGEIMHKVWTAQHGGQEKPYKKVADVLKGDSFLKLTAGSNSSIQFVTLDIADLAAAASHAAAAAGNGPGREGERGAEPPVTSPSAAAAWAGSAGAGAAAGGGGDHLRELLTAAAANAPSANSSNSSAAVIAPHTPEAGPDAAAAAAAAQLVALRVAQGAVLATDLLGYAGLISWHDSNPGLHLLRQQLACQIIESAHPGLAEAARSGQQVVASREEARYVMSPYAAGAALVATWSLYHPDQPKPYTSLPNALEGGKYIQLRLGPGGFQVQLEVTKMLQDCATTMQQMQTGWVAVADAGAAAVAARAPSALAAAGEAAASANVSPSASFSGAHPNAAFLNNNSHEHGLQVQLPGGIDASPTAAAAAAAAGNNGTMLPGGFAAVAAAADGGGGGGGASASGNSILSKAPTAIATLNGMPLTPQLPPLPLQPQVPSMLQLLHMLANAPLDACMHAAALLVPEAAQQLMFTDHEDVNFTANGDFGHAAYAQLGVQMMLNAAAVNRMLDHLLASPVVAFGCCTTSSQPAAAGGGQEQLQLLQVLAPGLPGHSVGSAFDAAVYVFEVPVRHAGPADQQLFVLLSILMEDARIVKVVQDCRQAVMLMQQHFGICARGMMEVKGLQDMLAPAGLLQAGADVSQSLHGHIEAYKQATVQLARSRHTIQSLGQRGCMKPASPEVVAASAAAVRPLLPLASASLELLPYALMRKCEVVTAV